MLNTLAYYLGYGAASAEEEIQQQVQQDAAGDDFKISELKEENGWDLIEKKGWLSSINKKIKVVTIT